MKKTLIIFGILVPLTLLVVWVYLLLNGAPKNLSELGSVFSPSTEIDVSTPSFPETGEEDGDAISIIDTTRPVVAISPKPVAGGVIFTRDGEEYVRYAERGTGHIYEVALADGVTARITNTTIPRATEAVWSPTGTRVAFTSEIVTGKPEFLIGTVTRTDAGGSVLDTFSLGPDTDNVLFNDTGDAFFYTTRSTTGTIGYRHDLKTGSVTELFQTPITRLTMLWDETGDGEHYAYTDPARILMGYLYKVSGGSLTYASAGAMGLTADRAGTTTLLVGIATAEGAYGEIRNLASGSTQRIGIAIFPEKCVARDALICASSNASLENYPDDWYQGAVSFNDTLWHIQPSTGNAEAIINLENGAGRPLDATDMTTNKSGTKLLFVDKRDSSLWLVNI